MPKFIEEKLKKEYGQNSDIPYKIMNKMGIMKGNKETAKGKEMEKKHAKSKAIENKKNNMKDAKNKALKKKQAGGTMKDIVHPKDRGISFSATQGTYNDSKVGKAASSVRGEGNKLRIYKK